MKKIISTNKKMYFPLANFKLFLIAKIWFIGPEFFVFLKFVKILKFSPFCFLKNFILFKEPSEDLSSKKIISFLL